MTTRNLEPDQCRNRKEFYFRTQIIVRGENTKINCGTNTKGEKGKRTPTENVDGRSTSSYDNKKFRTRSMEKQRGMEFGLRKTATAVRKYR
jgi:hypothetical protein